MKKPVVFVLSVLLILMTWTSMVYALGEKDKTVIYKIISHTKAGDLITYTAYSIVAHEKSGYWLQRTTSMQPDSKPLSITQTLLDDLTHEPLRYIMHRPANMEHPDNVLDLPLEKMGKEEILPTPLTKAFAEAGRVQVAAGTFEAKQGQFGDFMLWVNLDVPVLGVVKAETPDWTMELVRIDPRAVDLLPKKPKKGGIVYLNEE
jgi:hypothetical protein